ncbi:hypothetical protein F4Z99_19985 [Candidatus Poribacteria bacterium]|nr:hypothetical protein [Candidatus Poribacteria bacterium]
MISTVDIPLTVRMLYAIPSVSLSELRENFVVIAFSEQMLDFFESDIDITGGRITEFIGNRKEFCISIAPESATVEIYVPAGVAHNMYNQPNTESNRLTLGG